MARSADSQLTPADAWENLRGKSALDLDKIFELVIILLSHEGNLAVSGSNAYRNCQKFYENPGMRHERDDPEGGWKKDERFCWREDSVSVRIYPDGECIRVARQPRRFAVL